MAGRQERGLVLHWPLLGTGAALGLVLSQVAGAAAEDLVAVHALGPRDLPVDVDGCEVTPHLGPEPFRLSTREHWAWGAAGAFLLFIHGIGIVRLVFHAYASRKAEPMSNGVT